jgi:hypothetical protein
MKIIRLVLLGCLHVTMVLAIYMPKNWVALLDKGWQERRNNLLWWRPDVSLADSNEVFEPGYKMVMNEELRQTGDTLLTELVKPDGGNSNTVISALDRLSRSGTFDVTNVLEKALVLEKNAFRFQTLKACINAWTPDMSGLAKSAVTCVPPETLVAWERDLMAVLDKNPGARDGERTRLFLGYVPLVETEPAHAIAYDRLKLEINPGWRNSNARKILAQRFLRSERDADGYFSRVSGEIGLPPQPNLDEFFRLVEEAGNLWSHWNPKLAGPWPDSLADEWYRAVYETAPARFGVTGHELLRMVADRLERLPMENKRTWENEKLWERYVTALQYGGDPVATNALIKVVDAEWIPPDGPGRLDRALWKCDPNWMDSEYRKTFNDYAWRVAGHQEEQRRVEERRKKDQRLRRLFLLWWRPDDTSVPDNVARKQKVGKPQGDTVRTFEKMLGEQLFQPRWTKPEDVLATQKRLMQSGTYDVTNALSKFLIHKKTDAFRFPLLVGCIGTWQPDMSGLAETVVSRFPPEMREEWYSSLVQTNWDRYAEWQSPRMTVRKAVFLRAASLAETDAVCAVAIDRALPAVDTDWQGSNSRKCLALRFQNEGGAFGEHFRQVVADLGAPQPPTSRELDAIARCVVVDWPEDAVYIGAKPPESDAEGFRVALMLAEAEFGLPERDLLCLIAERGNGLAAKGGGDGTLLARYAAALTHAERMAERPEDATYFRTVLLKIRQGQCGKDKE